MPGDERLGPTWATCAELGLPLLTHTADPSAFFDPVDARNERLEEVAAHPDWHFGAHSFADLVGSLERLVATHRNPPPTEPMRGATPRIWGWVERILSAYPNFHSS